MLPTSSQMLTSSCAVLVFSHNNVTQTQNQMNHVCLTHGVNIVLSNICDLFLQLQINRNDGLRGKFTS